MVALSGLLDRLPYVGRLRRQLRAMRRSEGRYPAGHYHSPIPSEKDVLHHLARQRTTQPDGIPGVDLRTEDQRWLLEDYATYYDEVPFTEAEQPGLRYHYDQSWFCYADAIFLYCHLRSMKPQRIVEVGSGFSSAVILDTVERFLRQAPDVTLIEPNPARVLSLLTPGDRERVTLIQDQVQNVPLALFSCLEDGDLLLIDSSHVVKAGNDLYFLFFEVLPCLPAGVVVHFHDVFYPFDYRSDWLSMGRYWNEAYLLRAFLSHNAEWRIRFFSSYVGWRFREFLAQRMPLCLKDTGGSIYIERWGDTGAADS